MRLVQFLSPAGERRVGVVSDDGGSVQALSGVRTVYELAQQAARERCQLVDLVAGRGRGGDPRSVRSARPRPRARSARPSRSGALPGDRHRTDPSRQRPGARCHASCDAAGRGPARREYDEDVQTRPGGRPTRRGWAGRRARVVLQGRRQHRGGARAASDHAELCARWRRGGGDRHALRDNRRRRPCRVGYALGNEFADHVLERQNYLYLAHSKLRECAFGPELLLGELPPDVRGRIRVVRGGERIWQAEFISGEANMSHTLANLEHHHFKYPLFRRPGDVHVHFIGAAVLSFTAGVKAEQGDVFEIEVPAFGAPLRNPLALAPDDGMVRVQQLYSQRPFRNNPYVTQPAGRPSRAGG